MKHFGVLQVVPPGIEPGTQGFSVLCSTNWAMAPLFLVCGCKGRHSFRITKLFPRFFSFLRKKSRKCTISILTAPSVLPEKGSRICSSLSFHLGEKSLSRRWKEFITEEKNPFYIGEKINATRSCRHCTRTFDGHSPQKVHCLPRKKDDFFQEAFPGRNPPFALQKASKTASKTHFQRKNNFFRIFSSKHLVNSKYRLIFASQNRNGM